MTSNQQITKISSQYNLNKAIVEIITNKTLLQTITEDIRADRYVNLEITQFLYNTEFLPQLEEKLKVKRTELSNTNNFEKRIAINKEVLSIEEEVKQYKIDLLNTASTLIEIKETEKIKEVKNYFFKGQIFEAFNALSSSNLEETYKVLIKLSETQKNLEEIYEKLVDNSLEFFTKAQLTNLNLEIENLEDRFSKVIEFLDKGMISVNRSKKEKSIYSYKSSYAHFLQIHNQFNNANTLYFEALDVLRILVHVNPKIYLVDMMKTLNNLANLQSSKNEVTNAEKNYKEAIEIYRRLTQVNSKDYLPLIATTINNLATLQNNKNEFNNAEKNYEKVLEIYQKLVEVNPQIYLIELAGTFHNLAVLQNNKNEFNNAEKNYKKAIEIYGKLGQINPQSQVECREASFIANTFNNLAALQMENNDFINSQKNYDKALLITKELVEVNPQAYLPDMANIFLNLANLQAAKNEHKKALENYKLVLGTYRKLAESNSQTYLPHVAKTLYNLAYFHVNRNEFRSAEKNYEETLKIFRNLAQVDSQIYLPNIAKTLNNLANLQVDKKELDNAEKNYEETLKIFKKLAEDNPKIYISDLGQIQITLGSFYSEFRFDKKKSYKLTVEGMNHLADDLDNPFNEQYIIIALDTLQTLGINLEKVFFK